MSSIACEYEVAFEPSWYGRSIQQRPLFELCCFSAGRSVSFFNMGIVETLFKGDALNDG